LATIPGGKRSLGCKNSLRVDGGLQRREKRIDGSRVTLRSKLHPRTVRDHSWGGGAVEFA
jgi:hypothetical protein